jgi:hypothetical protein
LIKIEQNYGAQPQKKKCKFLHQASMMAQIDEKKQMERKEVSLPRNMEMDSRQ